jgi:parvulin-like peptidyl-prolyl isomerase
MRMNIKRLGLFVGLVLAVSACGKKAPEGQTADKATPGSKAVASKAGDKAPASKASPASKADSKKPAAAAVKLDLPEGPIARVNGTEIDRSEFVKKYTKMTKAFTTRKKEIPAGLAKRYKQSILKQLVDKELLAQQIKKQSVAVDDAALATEFTEYKKMFRTEENFQRYLKSSDISEAQIKGNIRHNLAVTKLLEKQGDLNVNDESIKAYFDKNQARYEIKEQVRASHILLKVPAKADKAKEAEAKKKADTAFKSASKKGADFAELAKKLSEGPTAPRGGDLSYFTKGRMVPAFEKVAFGLKVGEVSDPVRTQFGWHVIKVTDKKEGRQRPFAEVKDSISKLLKNKNSRKAKAELLKRLKADAKVDVLLPGVELTAPTLSPIKPMIKKMPASAAVSAAPKPANK